MWLSQLGRQWFLDHELILYIAAHLVLVVVVGATCSKKPKAELFQIGSG